MGKIPPKYIKLTLHPKWHADVIEIIANIEPGTLAATIIQLLRLYPQLNAQTATLTMGAPVSLSSATPAPSAPAAPKPMAKGAVTAAAPTEEIIMPPAATPAPAVRSRVNLSSGFAALDE